MKRAASFSEIITGEVGALPGVTSGPHRFGGIEFSYGRRELGHLHGNRTADLPFPRRIRDELIAAGRARVHPWVPDSGWVTVPIRTKQDVDNVVELFRMQHATAVEAERRQRSRPS